MVEKIDFATKRLVTSLIIMLGLLNTAILKLDFLLLALQGAQLVLQLS